MQIISDIEYSSGVVGDLFLPDEQLPEGGFAAVVLIHGGSWTSNDRHSVRGIADFLVENGFAVFNIEYRLAPQFRWPSGLEDCKNAVRYLADSNYPVNRRKISIIGASAGGHYALIAGLSLPPEMVCSIVSISGIDDVFSDYKFAPDRYWALLGGNPSERKLFELNPASYAGDEIPPVLCTHWRQDQVVPFESCIDFVKSVENKGGRICVYSYDFERQSEGHGIWIPGSEPHRLYPDIEAVIAAFLKTVISK